MRSGISVTGGSDRSLWRAALVAAALSAVFGLAGWWAGADRVEQAVLIARFTARVSLGLFVVVFVLGPGRRDWLAAFVTAHLIHFGTMIHLVDVHGLHMSPTDLVLGVSAYLAPVTALMVRGDPSATWRRVILDLVWLSFAVTYYHRLFEFPDRRAAGVFAFVLLVAALAARITLAVRRVRANRSASGR